MEYDLQSAAEQFSAASTAANRQAVAVAAQPLVRAIARKMVLPDHPLATYADLQNAGMLGMLQSLGSYDASRGTAFASFAYGRIRGALVDYLRQIDPLSRDRRRRVAEALRVSDELHQELGENPAPADVAARLGITADEVRQLQVDAQQRFTLSLHPDPTDAARGPLPLEALPHPDAEAAEAELETRSLYDHVCGLIERFPAREQRIVKLYYLDGLTLREIAGEFGLTEARISQILSKTLRTLRGRIGPMRQAA